MRKYLFIVFVFLFILNVNYFCNFGFVYASEPIYYRIINDNTMLYKSPTKDNSLENIYFYLPKTYFVKYNNDFNENFLNVTYKNYTGYVDKKCLQRVYTLPTSPFENGRTFAIQEIANLVIRQAPTTASEFLGTIPCNETSVEFIGKVDGEKVNESLSSEWYYCRYKSFSQGIISGYVYAPLTKNLTEFKPNLEEVSIEESQLTNTDSILAPELKTKSNLMLILGLSIPAILLLFLILKSTKKQKRKQNTSRQIHYLNNLSLPDKTDKNEFDF